jgi:hypothetical protein
VCAERIHIAIGGNFALFSGVRGTYICAMWTRGILIVVSILGVTATVIAVIEGAWIYALALYGMSVSGIAVLLGRAVRRHRVRNDMPLRTAPDQAAQGPHVQPGVVSPHS